ncbi:MAG: hypothetical protein KatS3mg105_2082 [Gemmatales bacterium]|nr:MAG: hypothetical protein KatS3mg105_2082 [Gemmatales bacterium]
MIFAREISDPLTSLVKKVNEATAKHSDARLGSFVVFVNANDDLEAKVKKLAETHKIDKTILSTMSTPSGPPKYKVAKDADVTVILYNKRVVKANYAFEKGKLTDADVQKILNDLPKILSDK